MKAIATVIICLGSLGIGLTLPKGGENLDLYRYCAYSAGGMLALAFLIEAQAGLRALVRLDIIALLSLYFLTFAEFLHPHVITLYVLQSDGAPFACQLVLIATACLAIGRHLPLPAARGGGGAQLPNISDGQVYRVFLLLYALGFMYVFWSIGFNLFDLFSSMMEPRFAKPWGRGAIGGWLSFATELQLLLYACAALGGYIFANAKKFSVARRVFIVLLLTFMVAFDISEGARNVVLIKTGLFMASYFTCNAKTVGVRLIVMSIVAFAMLWLVSGFMLQVRNMGLREYLSDPEAAAAAESSGFMIDNNMVTMARVVEIFPNPYPFPGADIVVSALTKWVPRALWADKPVEWTNSIESALNTGGGYTLATTYVGEAYLIAGIPSLVVVSLVLGSLAATWTRVGVGARSNFDLVLYALGFFPAMLGMRSIQFITIAIVPVAAFYVLGRVLGRARIARTPRLRRSASTGSI